MKNQTALLTAAITLALSFNAAPLMAFGGHGGMHLQNFVTENDVNQDGQVTQDEVQFMRDQFFTKADTNQDDGLSSEELLAAHEQRMQEHLTARFTALDTDKNGSVTAAELAAGIPADAPAKAATHITQRLQQQDTNGDGALSLAEFLTKPTDKANMMQQRHAQHFSRMDTNSDGVISRAEFVANVPVFDRLDTNEDGILSAEEITAAQQQRPNAPHAGGGKGKFR